jgi:hypothetical protein
MKLIGLNRQEKKALSGLSHLEDKEKRKFHPIVIFSKKLKRYIEKDIKDIHKKKRLAASKRFSEISVMNPSLEFIFAGKEIKLIKEIINLTEASISKEREIESDIRGRYGQLSDKGKVLLDNLFRHITEEEKLDSESLKLEIGLSKSFNDIIARLNEKNRLIEEQRSVLAHKNYVKILKFLEAEEVLNDYILSLINDILDSESKVIGLGKRKRLILSPFKSSGKKKSIAGILSVIILVAATVFFFQPRAEEAPNYPLINQNDESYITLSSIDITNAKFISLDIKAKNEFINSLMQLYYYSDKKCNDKACVLSQDSINVLLGEERNIKKAALGAKIISLEGNILGIKSESPLSAVLPASMKSATLVIHNTDWAVSESNGNFIFKRVPVYKDGKRIDQAKLKLGFLATIGKLFKPINSMDNINEAWLIKYSRDDGSPGLYGILIWRKDDGSIITNGVDLTSEDFSSVNAMSYNDVAKLIAT